ncbi:hypothetical protein AAFO92_10985 [Roseovarius sp. CAU 1744]|uniref:hypothetical protein n=1 Tax=Roseovarius sp. CAU 1744 TaxID=3140368 RepID=UPI00325AAFB8
MNAMVARYVFLGLLCLGILLPQGSALLAAAGLADGRVLVICTGDGLRTIRISDEGEPVEISQEAELCALVDTTDTSAMSRLPGSAPHLLYATAPALPHPPEAFVFARFLPRSRAPPVS